MKAIITHYGTHDLTWTKDFECTFYDRSGSGLGIKRENVGDADYDKLTYICDHYDSLPEAFLLTKSNIFKFITPEEWEKVKHNTDYTPILTQTHRTYEDAQGPVNFYCDGMYYERNNSWYLAAMPCRFRSYQEFAATFGLPSPAYLPFAPGGSYIVTRERIHRYPKALYEALRDLLPYTQRPGEAHLIERTYHTLWR